MIKKKQQQKISLAFLHTLLRSIDKNIYNRQPDFIDHCYPMFVYGNGE